MVFLLRKSVNTVCYSVKSLSQLYCIFQKLDKEWENEKGKFYGRVVDLRDESKIVDDFNWIKEHLGGVDILINNAGVSTRTRVLGKCTIS